MRPTRGLSSAPLPLANQGCALLFGLAPGRVCRVSPRRPTCCRPADSSLWHWSSPHGGRVLPATLRWGARTFLGEQCSPRPSDRLAGQVILPRCRPDRYPKSIIRSTEATKIDLGATPHPRPPAPPRHSAREIVPRSPATAAGARPSGAGVRSHRLIRPFAQLNPRRPGPSGPVMQWNRAGPLDHRGRDLMTGGIAHASRCHRRRRSEGPAADGDQQCRGGDRGEDDGHPPEEPFADREGAQSRPRHGEQPLRQAADPV